MSVPGRPEGEDRSAQHDGHPVSAPLMITAAAAPEQRWRNGGGRTRELLAWPSAEFWALRISLADVEADGAFSSFGDIERWFAVVDGHGVTLDFGGVEQRLDAGGAPLRFDGGNPPTCRLVDGPTRDLNLMLQRARGEMRAVQSGTAWSAAFAMCGIYALAAGRWRNGAETHDIGAHTLAWWLQADGRDWHFETETAGVAGYWLGCTPDATWT
jgi:environmental stress-induced protein Ves